LELPSIHEVQGTLVASWWLLPVKASVIFKRKERITGRGDAK
jgi:hypothetical protein